LLLRIGLAIGDLAVILVACEGVRVEKDSQVALLRKGVPHPVGKPSRGMHKFNHIGA